MDNGKIHNYTNVILTSYKSFSSRDMDNLSLSDYLCLRNQAIMELEKGITVLENEENDKKNVKKVPDKVLQSVKSILQDSKVKSPDFDNKDTVDNSIASSENEETIQPVLKSDFEILKSIKDEWN